MAFDGIDHRDAAWIYPIHYCPRQPVTAIAAGEALRIAYVYARTQNRVCWQYAAGWEFPASTRLPISAVAWTRLAGGRHRIPLAATHLVCAAGIRFAGRWEAQAHLRLVTDSGTADNGTAVVVDSATRADLDLAHRRLWGVATSAEELGLAPFDEAADQARVLVAVKLANTAAGDLTHTQLQGYALHAAASTAEPLDLLWATCWWDVRED